MPERRRWTVRDLRRDNRSVLLWSLYFDQPCSRQDLSEATGLSSASVSNVIRELIAEGIVIEAGSVDSDGGRPRVLLRINPDFGYVVGIDVGETRVRAELFDLTMNVRANADYPLEPREHGVDVVVDRILACLRDVLAESGVPPDGVPRTMLGWEVRAAGLEQVLDRLAREYGARAVYVTENGSAWADQITPDGQVHDGDRIRYLEEHLAACGRAVRRGVPLAGYFAWSLLDNFEWDYGYNARFGLVHVDYATQQRVMKDSGRRYAEIIAAHGQRAAGRGGDLTRPVKALPHPLIIRSE